MFVCLFNLSRILTLAADKYLANICKTYTNFIQPSAPTFHCHALPLVTNKNRHYAESLFLRYQNKKLEGIQLANVVTKQAFKELPSEACSTCSDGEVIRKPVPLLWGRDGSVTAATRADVNVVDPQSRERGT